MQAVGDVQQLGEAVGQVNSWTCPGPPALVPSISFFTKKPASPSDVLNPSAVMGRSPALLKPISTSPRGNHGDVSVNAWVKHFKEGESLTHSSQGLLVSLSTTNHCLGWGNASTICIFLTFHSFSPSPFDPIAFPVTKRSW